jgi:hypothetical protein
MSVITLYSGDQGVSVDPPRSKTRGTSAVRCAQPVVVDTAFTVVAHRMAAGPPQEPL